MSDDTTEYPSDGDSLSHYRIVERLGKGGMGVVYRAVDLRLNRPVAIKFMGTGGPAKEEDRERFRREAEAAAALDHPNVCTIYGIEEFAGRMFIVMALVEGESLEKRIGGRPIPVPDTLEIALQVAEGLRAAHEKQIVHRDIKPANIIIATEGRVKILDFGLAKLAHRGTLTQLGAVVGTVGYMSPEQVSGEAADSRSDIWSLGVLIYEMLCGRSPFAADYAESTMYRILNEEPEPPTALRSNLPIELDLVVQKSLRKNPAERYQQIQEMIVDLRAVRRSLGSAESRTSQTDRNRMTTESPRARRSSVSLRGWKLYALLIAAAVIAAFILTTPFTRKPPIDPDPSIAVIGSMGAPEPGSEHLADGITNEVIRHLSGHPNLLVISKSSSDRFANSELSDSSIAQMLGVRYLLKVGFRPAGAHLAIHASLVDGRLGVERWKSPYLLPRNDLTKIGGMLASEVSSALEVQTSSLTRTLSTRNPQAYELYLRGLYHARHLRKNDNLLTIEYLAKAVAIDTLYADAWCVLGDALSRNYEYGWDRASDVLGQAAARCRTALALDSTHATAWAVLGAVLLQQGDHAGAHAALDRSIGLDPNNIRALTELGQLYLFSFGEPVRGLSAMKRAFEVDPQSAVISSNLGVAYAQLREYDDAILAFRRSMTIDPRYYLSIRNLGYTFERMGRFDSALVFYRRAIEANQNDPIVFEGIAGILVHLGEYARAESLLLVGTRVMPTAVELYYHLGISQLLGRRSSAASETFRNGLQLAQRSTDPGGSTGDHHAQIALFEARLGNKQSAARQVALAASLDSTDSYVLIKIARVYALLSEKNQMLIWYSRAKRMNPEYDGSYLMTTSDFSSYRNDPDLLLLARSE